MATINASTMLTVKKKVTAPPPPAKTTASNKMGILASSSSIAGGGAKKAAPAGRRGAVAPPLKPKDLNHPTLIAALQGEPNASVKQQRVLDIFAKAVGAAPSMVSANSKNGTTIAVAAPHAASTTRDRGNAAADLAVAAKHLSVQFVLKECGILNELQRNLFPDGIATLLSRGGAGADDEKSNDGGGGGAIGGGSLKPSTSSLSLSSLCLDNDAFTVATTAANSANTDSKRGKATPPAAREGCLLVLRALCQIVGRHAEPYICGAFLAAALDECASANSAVREAAEDCVTALTALANPWAFSTVMAPIVLQSLQCTEWRVKAAALELCLVHFCTTTPGAGQRLHPYIPVLIPACASQVWDTKPQVAKAAKAALLAICDTNINTDIRPAIPWIVNAICKPAETNRAVSELMSTTFVVPVDASTLAILCPVLARALKEKLAIHKRAACIVISNMAKLVDSPASVAPFGSLLVPELQKVAANVQFEEIRDESLKALKNLTKALGEQYKAAVEEAAAAAAQNTTTTNGSSNGSSSNKEDMKLTAAAIAALEQEQSRVEAEQLRIQLQREALAAEEEAHRQREAQERRVFKEAMDAQRHLDQMAAEEASASAAAEQQRKEMLKLSTKGEGGKCQACGLKKCKKTCNFYAE